MVLNIRSLFAKKKGCSVAKKEALNEIGTPKQNNEVSTLLLHLAEKKADFVHNFTASDPNHNLGGSNFSYIYCSK